MHNIMQKLHDETVKWKLSFMTKVMIGLMVVLGLGAILGAFELHSLNKELAENWMVANNVIADLDYNTSDYRLNQYRHVVTTSTSEYNSIEEGLDVTLATINDLMAEYEQTISSNVDREYYNKAVNAWNEYLQLTGKTFFDYSRKGDKDTAGDLLAVDGYAAYHEFQDNFDALLTFNHEQANACATRAEVFYWVIIGLVVVMVGIAILIGTRISKVIVAGITEPINELMYVNEEMTKGNLKAELSYISQDELGVLSDSMRFTLSTLSAYVDEISDILVNIARGDLTKDFNEITDFLGDFGSIKESFVYILKEFNKTLTNIQEASMQVDSGAADLAGAASELANGTTEQAGAVEELTATINNVNAMAEESAKRAEESYHTVLESVREAETEKQKMYELQDEMGRIKDISNEIEAIIASIEEIASQTSLLSLNASIEAQEQARQVEDLQLLRTKSVNLQQTVHRQL